MNSERPVPLTNSARLLALTQSSAVPAAVHSRECTGS